MSWSCSDRSSGTSNSIPVTVTEQGITCTFVNAPDRTSISGFKYDDEDGDLNTTDDQTGVINWVIDLYSCVTDFDTCSFFSTTNTAADGSYSFTNLVSGLFKVIEGTVLGWTNLSPTSVNVETDPNEDATDINFVNFKNGVISGYKWNDVDGDGIWDDGEPALEEWEILLNGDTGNAAVTDSEGYYEFTDLGPGTYEISEVNQTGWNQTYPEGGSHEITMTSDGSYEDVNFGNQGQGTITVYKDLDTNGDLQTDESNVAGWTWDIADGSQDNPMGGTAVNVVAGTYTISEDQQDLYNVQNLVCERANLGAVESAQVTVSAGENVICTFTNTRKTGTVTFDKIVVGGDASEDDWTFTIDGVDGSFSDGDQVTLTTGEYSVSESGDADYDATAVGGICSNLDGLAATLTVTENGGTCSFTNTRDTGGLTVNKEVDTDADGTYEGGNAIANSLGFMWGLDAETPARAMASTAENLETGSYDITEAEADHYNFTGWYYTGLRGSCEEPVSTNLPTGIEVAQNETTEITLCNAHDTATVTVDKVTNPGQSEQSFEFNILNGEVEVAGFSLTDTDEPESTTVLAGETYSVTEIVPEGWDATDAECVRSDEQTVDIDGFTLTSGQEVFCTITNTLKRGSITIIKDAVPNGGQDFEFTTEGLDPQSFELDDDEDDTLSNTQVFENVLPGTYTVEELGEEGWDLTSVTCTDENSDVPSTVDDNQVTVNVEPDENVTCTFTNTQRGSIGGQKIEDADGDLETTDDQEPVEGWLIELYQLVDDVWSFFDDALTNVLGFFSFTGLVPGTYEVREVMPLPTLGVAGWTALSPTGVPVTLDAGEEDNGNDFYNFQNVSVTVCKVIDNDGDLQGEQDQTPYAGWPVSLMVDGQVVGDAVSTDRDGCYTWTDLGPGHEYGVQEGEVAGYVPLGDTTQEFGQAQSGEEYTHTFYNQGRGTITVVKLVDTDGNGQTDGEVNEFEDLDWEWMLNSDEGHETSETVDVPAGDHTIDESSLEGYQFTNLTCDTENYNTDGSFANVTVNPGDEITCTYENTRDTGTVTVTKFHDRDASGFWDEESDEETLDGWEINLGEYSDTTDESGNVEFTVPTGTYDLSETIKEGWIQSNIYCQTNDSLELNANNLEEVTVEQGDEISCYIGNYQDGEIIVIKYNDANGNGIREEGEETLEGWEMNLEYDENTDSQTTDENGQTTFENLAPGTYNLSETQQEGWEQTGLSCENQNNRLASIIDIQSSESVTCEVGNQSLDPVLTIAKRNDTGGAVETPGATVVFTITVTASDSAVLDTEVVDVPSEGIVYVAGSWTAEKNGAPFAIPEPTYASPGTWSLGDLNPGDEVVLTYQGRISPTQDTGIYPDLAWADGTSLGGAEVLAQAQPEGFVDPNFVGTEVIIESVQYINDSHETKREEKVEGKVLGATTILPATGSATMWLVLGALLTVGGAFGISRNRGYKLKLNKKKS